MKLVVVFFGLTASGKSYLAGAWALRHGFPYYNTDVIRKHLAGIAADRPRPEKADQGIYSAEFSRRTYEGLVTAAVAALQEPSAHCVVLDGSYHRLAERDRLRQALAGSCRLVFVFCSCEEAVTRERLALRATDPEAVSDGSLEIFFLQKQTFDYPVELSAAELINLDTNASVTVLMDRLDNLLLTSA